jgi:hypothetical protein
MEFFLAPYPVNGTPADGDPAKAPDITNNSWDCPPSEGCSVNSLQAAVEAQRAAGIMMVVAAGNSGPSCSTVVDPPSLYEASYTVGALTTGTDTIASFSSRGPVTVDGSNRLKPNITAPGTAIRSSYNTSDTAYATFSGTSAATPHIAGAMALLWSARPDLRHNIAASRAALNDSAVHILSALCGSQGPPNNVYGWGRVDVFGAVASSLATVGDFNIDGKPDYVLYNANTRQTAVWSMNNNVFLGGASGPTLPGVWRVVGAADFNQDGKTDYLLFNFSTHQTAIWYLSGVTLVGGAFGPTLPSAWRLVGVGDFNGDGKPDYVLYNASTRRTAIWYMNNNAFAGGAFGPTLPAAWRVVGVADFNGNGRLDYLLFNASTHQTAIWYLSGVTLVGGAFGPTLPSAWRLVGVGDFNGDGSPDDVLYNASTRQTAIWYMNNNLFAGGAFGPTLPGAWNLVAP